MYPRWFSYTLSFGCGSSWIINPIFGGWENSYFLVRNIDVVFEAALVSFTKLWSVRAGVSGKDGSFSIL